MHTLTHKQVRSDWFQGTNQANLHWNGIKLVLPPTEDPATLFKPRGQDFPTFPIPCEPKHSKRPSQMDHGSLAMVTCSGEVMTLGNVQASSNSGDLKFAIGMDSQIPSLSLGYVRRSQNGIVQRHHLLFHGNTAMTDVEYHSPDSLKAKLPEPGAYPFPIPAVHMKAAAEGRLFGVTLKFRQRTGPALQRMQSCITVMHSQLPSGETGGSADRWVSHEDMVEDFRRNNESRRAYNSNYLTGFDQMIYLMFAAPSFDLAFFRELVPSDIRCAKAFDLFYKYWASIMKLAIRRGPFWFYTLQPGFNPVQGQHFINWQGAAGPPVPFWCIFKWKALVSADGLESLCPLEWHPIVARWDQTERRNMMPSGAVTSLLNELGAVRRRNQGLAAAQADFIGLDSGHLTDETWPSQMLPQSEKSDQHREAGLQRDEGNADDIQHELQAETSTSGMDSAIDALISAVETQAVASSSQIESHTSTSRPSRQHQTSD